MPAAVQIGSARAPVFHYDGIATTIHRSATRGRALAAQRSQSMAEPIHRPDHHPPTPPVRWSVGDWVWFVAKNIIGWALVLSAGPIGMLLPGPGGLPLFLIGFALVSLPGKRHATARIIRGRPVSRDSTAYRWFVGVFSILAPAAVLSFLTRRWILLSEIREVTNDPTKIREFIWSWSILVAIVYLDRKSTRLNSSHSQISYAVFC